MPKDDKNKNKNRQTRDPDDLDDLEGGDDDLVPNNTGDTVRSTLERIFSSGNFRSVAYQEVRALEQKNNRLLRRNRELKSQVDELEQTKPGDDSVVLAKDDAAEWAAFKKLNVKATDVEKTIKEHGDLKAKDVERADEEKFADAAEALGYENVALFTRMLTREGLHLEFRDERVKDEDSGKTITVRVPVVRPKADDKAELEPLDSYLEREMPEIVPVLQAEPEGEDDEDEGEMVGAGAGSDSAERAIRRFSAGERGTRNGNSSHSTRSREAVATGGVRMPVTRNARPSTGASRDDKRQKEAIEQKRQTGNYGL